MSLTMSCLRHHSSSKDSNYICLDPEPSLSHAIPYLKIDTVFGTIYLCDFFLKSFMSDNKKQCYFLERSSLTLPHNLDGVGLPSCTSSELPLL